MSPSQHSVYSSRAKSEGRTIGTVTVISREMEAFIEKIAERHMGNQSTPCLVSPSQHAVYSSRTKSEGRTIGTVTVISREMEAFLEEMRRGT